MSNAGYFTLISLCSLLLLVGLLSCVSSGVKPNYFKIEETNQYGTVKNTFYSYCLFPDVYTHRIDFTDLESGKKKSLDSDYNLIRLGTNKPTLLQTNKISF